MTGYLTTHVLDTAHGRPAVGVPFQLFRLLDGQRFLLGKFETNADGRTDRPILPQEDFALGTYELAYQAGIYLRAVGASDAFLQEIPIRFTMTEPAHYHVPLLLSPYGYSTYRGS
ncbi:MAG: hydroxyisourate hydrolase [Pseudomonadota bacterium]